MTLEARKIRLVMELRQDGITDRRVLGAIERVPRELFVPANFHDQAYENTALPIGHGQTISQPSVVAFMTERLKVGERMKVLEIGTGCGYQAAVLAQLCRRVYTIERYRELLKDAEKRFAAMRLRNITTLWGDGTGGWPDQAPFDRIIMTAASARVPERLIEQLTPDGMMIAPIGQASQAQALILFRRTEDGYETEELWPVRFVPMVEGTVDRDENVSHAGDVRVG